MVLIIYFFMLGLMLVFEKIEMGKISFVFEKRVGDRIMIYLYVVIYCDEVAMELRVV